MCPASACITCAHAWGDIEAWEDGSGRLIVRRSKTDQEGRGAVVYLSPQTMADLARDQAGWHSRDGSRVRDSAWPRRRLQRPLRPRQARLPDDREGSAPADVQRQSRRKSPEMIAVYTHAEAAGQAGRYLG